MNSLSHSVTFNKKCSLQDYPHNDNFKASLQIAPGSPGQFALPCPDTVLLYESNSTSDIEFFIHYGVESKLEIKTKTEVGTISLSPNADTKLPHFPTDITILNFKPLRFNDSDCSCSDDNVIINQDKTVRSKCYGILSYSLNYRAYYIHITLKWPDVWESKDNPKELTAVCQDGHQTTLSFPFKRCTIKSCINGDCTGCDSTNSNFKLIVNPSMGMNDTSVVAVSHATPPINWAVEIVRGGTATIEVQGSSKTRAVVTTKKACGGVIVTASDKCGGSGSKLIEIDECCPDFKISLVSTSADVGSITPGQLIVAEFATSGQSQEIVWAKGRDVITVDWMSPDYGTISTAEPTGTRGMYISANADACKKSFKFGVIDNCNPDYILYVEGTINTEIPCCPPKIPTTWNENNPQTITQNGSAAVSVVGSLSNKNNFIWSLSGQGFTFSNGSTATTGGSSQMIYADGHSCGRCDITITDTCGVIVDGSLRNINGQWVDISYKYEAFNYANFTPAYKLFIPVPYISGDWQTPDNPQVSPNWDEVDLARTGYAYFDRLKVFCSTFSVLQNDCSSPDPNLELAHKSAMVAYKESITNSCLQDSLGTQIGDIGCCKSGVLVNGYYYYLYLASFIFEWQCP